MLTHTEVMKLLRENYTPEELCDILSLCPGDLLSGDIVQEICLDKHDELVERIQEDTGYGITSDES